jgi:hypothetical protein
MYGYKGNVALISIKIQMVSVDNTEAADNIPFVD